MAIPIDIRAREEQERIIALRLEAAAAQRAFENLSKRYRALLHRHDIASFSLILSVLLNVILAYVGFFEGGRQ